jgi:hypothetical protein
MADTTHEESKWLVVLSTGDKLLQQIHKRHQVIFRMNRNENLSFKQIAEKLHNKIFISFHGLFSLKRIYI